MSLEAPHPQKHAPVAYAPTELPAGSGIPQDAASIHQTLKILSAPVATTVNAPNKTREGLTIIEALERLQIRQEQLGKLLALVNENSTDDEKLQQFHQALKLCPQFTPEELVAIISQPELVRNHKGLRDAIIVGGKTLTNRAGATATLYPLNIVLGVGGMGQVKDGFMIKDGKWEAVVIKEPKKIPATNDPEVAADNLARHNAYLIEAKNASEYLPEPIPHVLEVMFVSELQPDTDLPIIVYRKIVDSKNKTTNLAEVFINNQIAPSRKLATLTTAIYGIAELHDRGLTHYDFKPGNVAIDAQGGGVVIDPGSMFRQNQVIALDDSPNRTAGIYRPLNKNGTTEPIQLAYTPRYMDNSKVYRGLTQNKPLTIADRYSVGVCIEDLLISCFLVNIDPSQPAFIQDRLKLQSGYPPDSIKALTQIAEELKDIDSNTPLRPMTEIAAQVRELVHQMSIDTDPIHQKWIESYQLQQINQL